MSLCANDGDGKTLAYNFCGEILKMANCFTNSKIFGHKMNFVVETKNKTIHLRSNFQDQAIFCYISKCFLGIFEIFNNNNGFF